jgi:HD-GYP domain-containing protein (c-di-GMP phosphodiesterase class II)
MDYTKSNTVALEEAIERNTAPRVLMLPSSNADDQYMYFKISSSIFLNDITVPCDIFRKTSDQRFVLIAKKGLALNQRIKLLYLEHSGDALFARFEDDEKYAEALADQIEEAAEDTTRTTEERSAIMYSSCIELLRKSFSDPRAVFVRQLTRSIAPVVETIIKNKQMTDCLFQLTDHDDSTATHSMNSAIFGIAFAKRCLNSAQVDFHELGAGMFMHDIGKCQIDLDILTNPGKLSDDEFRQIKQHPILGRDVLISQGVKSTNVIDIAAQHHERDDGFGYPFGLTRDEINPLARIARMVDVYEALTATRPYREKMQTFSALKLMRDEICPDVERSLFADFVKLFEV